MSYSLRALFDEVDARRSSDDARCTLRKLSRLLRADRHVIEESVRDATGLTFREFRDTKLLSRSLALLIGNRDVKIKQISLILGFRHPGDFTRFIKKSTGKTPIEIRQSGTVDVDVSAACAHEKKFSHKC